MSGEYVMLSARVPEELKRLVDADERTNQEIVESALWRDFGGERKAALDRRVEEIENRLGMVKRERNERDRELEELRDELEAIKAKRENAEQVKELQLQEAREALARTPKDVENQAVQNWAEKLEMSPEKLLEEL
jgi:chromosome segregation ATPase